MVSGLASDLMPPANDPMSGGVHTVAATVAVQQGEKSLPAFRLAHPVLTGRQAFDSDERYLHPAAKDLTPALPADAQVRIGYLDVSRGSHPLVYALIDETAPCANTLAPPQHVGTCPSWDFLSSSTGRYVAGGHQVATSAR
jgi:hypothetical protein